MTEESPRNPRVLKAVVIILGVIFLAMMALFIYGLAVKVGGKKGGIAAAIDLPPGETLIEMTGAGDYLVLRLRDAQGGERLFYVDPATGKATGSTRLTPAP
ncbi:hypothetical protein [Zavarzinia compransoris]|uniref:Uncharacterized protein n=1 Tax=Zavarzinia compransoris TaxID=1264899 RepID=A0A317E667_9PROT|nr:hypothetical protein [Zavarzinia compransoris]PWR21696.1 hypothetical protein DKG75_06775 [Zavarzinia compransoris]TDP45518.1 hypothetical protein DES42_105224 [Zavarzinia compransoris]